MADLQERVIQHGLFTYTGPDGSELIAYRGQTVALSESDIARGEKHDAFGVDETIVPVDVIASVVTTSDDPPVDEDSDNSAYVARPAQVEAKEAWVAYAVTQGMTTSEAESTSKAELISRFKD